MNEKRISWPEAKRQAAELVDSLARPTDYSQAIPVIISWVRMQEWFNEFKPWLWLYDLCARMRKGEGIFRVSLRWMGFSLGSLPGGCAHCGEKAA